MSDTIPAALWEKVKAFLADERTGQITLNVNRGKVESADLREHVRACVLTKDAKGGSTMR